MACDGGEVVHPSRPVPCMQTGGGGAEGGDAAISTLEDIHWCWGQQGAHAAKVHDIPAIATTYTYPLWADDSTNVSLNQNHGAVSLTALHAQYLDCKLFRAVVSYCEHFCSFGWGESCSYHGSFPNRCWCWAVWRQRIPLQIKPAKQVRCPLLSRPVAHPQPHRGSLVAWACLEMIFHYSCLHCLSWLVG